MANQPNDSEIEPITQSDVEAFASKLDEWGSSLDPKERAALAVLLSKSGEPGDVQGYLQQFNSSFSQLALVHLQPALVQGVGMHGFNPRAAGDNWLNMGWMKSGMPQGNPAARF